MPHSQLVLSLFLSLYPYILTYTYPNLHIFILRSLCYFILSLHSLMYVLILSNLCHILLSPSLHSHIHFLIFGYIHHHILVHHSLYSSTSVIILSLYSLISVIVLSHQCPHLISTSLLFHIPYLNSSNICPHLTESLSLHSLIRVLTLSYPCP
jgi:hypothetical protein